MVTQVADPRPYAEVLVCDTGTFNTEAEVGNQLVADTRTGAQRPAEVPIATAAEEPTVPAVRAAEEGPVDALPEVGINELYFER